MKDIGHDGLNKLLAAYEDKSARAVCTFGFSQGPGHEPVLFQGVTDVSSVFACPASGTPHHTCCMCVELCGTDLTIYLHEQGKIVPSRGPTTFGWDSIFEYEGQT